MMTFDKWVMPDTEAHLPVWMTHANHRVQGRLTYQKSKYDAAMAHVKQRRVGIDIGAHIGLMSYWMAQNFQILHAFEPKPEHVRCWNVNMEGHTNAYIYETALGDELKEVGLLTGSSSSGDTSVVLDGHGTPMRTLDSFHFNDVDFIKIDCEGFEAFILEGAKDTLTRCRPTVMVEQKPGHGQRFGRGELDAVTLLTDMGAKQVWCGSGDYVLTFGAH